MSLQLANISFDCTDALVVGGFWSAVLGHDLDPDGSADFTSVGLSGTTQSTPAWLFMSVPEGKSAKNRMHVDLTSADRQVEVDRLVGLGATHVRDVEEWGHSWTVLQDPEGNEFCVAQEAAAAEGSTT
jgi:hypothetical protein